MLTTLKIFTPADDVLYFMNHYENNEITIMFDELNIPFTHDELMKSVKQLKSNRST